MFYEPLGDARSNYALRLVCRSGAKTSTSYHHLVSSLAIDPTAVKSAFAGIEAHSRMVLFIQLCTSAAPARKSKAVIVSNAVSEWISVSP